MWAKNCYRVLIWCLPRVADKDWHVRGPRWLEMFNTCPRFCVFFFNGGRAFVHWKSVRPEPRPKCALFCCLKMWLLSNMLEGIVCLFCRKQTSGPSDCRNKIGNNHNSTIMFLFSRHIAGVIGLTIFKQRLEASFPQTAKCRIKVRINQES